VDLRLWAHGAADVVGGGVAGVVVCVGAVGLFDGGDALALALLRLGLAGVAGGVLVCATAPAGASSETALALL